MNEPVNGRNEDSAEKCGQRPKTATNQESLAAKMPPLKLCVGENSECETDVDYGRKYPYRENPIDACA